MMPRNPDVSLQTLSAVDGFLAGLIYLSATKQIPTHGLATGVFYPTGNSWQYVQSIWANLESVQNRMLMLVPTLSLQGIDDTLDSFIYPIDFFQAAVLSLRSSLIGRPPSTLGDVVALFCLSHMVSHHLKSCHNLANSHTQLDIDQWGNAISRYDHRQAFVSLIRALFPEITTPTPPLRSLGPVTADQNDPHALHLAMYQDTPSEPPLLESELIGSSLEYSDMILNWVSLTGSQPTNQEAHNDLYTSGETRFQTLATSDPHGSALVANFTPFLKQCRDLFQSLSGSWVTAMNQYSPSSALNRARPQSNDVSSYLQRMRQDGSFQDPSSMGILSIVDTFVQLGYLQTLKDVQEYMITVGQEIIPNREYLNFVANTFGIALPSGSRSPSAPRTAGPERKFSCPKCPKRFTRKSNMQRHRNSVHKHELGSNCLTGPAIEGVLL